MQIGSLDRSPMATHRPIFHSEIIRMTQTVTSQGAASGQTGAARVRCPDLTSRPTYRIHFGLWCNIRKNVDVHTRKSTATITFYLELPSGKAMEIFD